MRPSGAGRRTSGASDARLYVLIASASLAQHHRSDPPVCVFRSEGAARNAFRRLRLEVGSGSGWGELVAVDDDVVQPLCWFGRPPEHAMPSGGSPRRPSRRWAVAALALTMGALLWAFVGTGDRAGAAVAPHVSRSSLITVSEGQVGEATVLNTSDACHRKGLAGVSDHPGGRG